MRIEDYQKIVKLSHELFSHDEPTRLMYVHSEYLELEAKQRLQLDKNTWQNLWVPWQAHVKVWDEVVSRI